MGCARWLGAGTGIATRVRRACAHPAAGSGVSRETCRGVGRSPMGAGGPGPFSPVLPTRPMGVRLPPHPHTRKADVTDGYNFFFNSSLPSPAPTHAPDPRMLHSRNRDGTPEGRGSGWGMGRVGIIGENDPPSSTHSPAPYHPPPTDSPRPYRLQAPDSLTPRMGGVPATAILVPCWRIPVGVWVYTLRGMGIHHLGNWIPYPVFFLGTLHAIFPGFPIPTPHPTGKRRHGPIRSTRGDSCLTVARVQRVECLGVASMPQPGIMGQLTPGISRECAQSQVLGYDAPIATHKEPAMRKMRYTFTVWADQHDPETAVRFSVIARNPFDAFRAAVQWCDDADIIPDALTITSSEDA